MIRRREKILFEKVPYLLEHLVLVQELQVIEKHKDCQEYRIDMFLVFTLRALHFAFEPLQEPCLQLSHLLYEK